MRNDGQRQEPLLVSGKHGGNPEARTTRTGVLERIGFEETGWVDTRRFSGGYRWLDGGGQRLNKEVEAKKRKLQETIVRGSGKDARMGDAMNGSDGSLSS